MLNQQIAALRRQLGALEQALDASEKPDKDSQSRIADLGQRLNVALAQRVQELSRYRSDFFGRLREILGNRPDIRVVGDRFVLQSEVFFDPGHAVLKPEGSAELDKIAAALLDLDRQIPDDIAWVLRVDGHTDVRPIGGESAPTGSCRRRAPSRWCNPDQQGHPAAASRRRRLRRIPAARHRQHRRCLPPQPPHRAEADRAVSEVRTLQGPPLRRRRRRRGHRAVAADLAGRLSGYRFRRARGWWRERWREELVPQAQILVAEMDGVLEGFVTVDPKTGYLDQIVVAPEFWGSNVAELLLDAGKRVSPARLDLMVNKDNARAIAFYGKNGFDMAGDDVNPVSGPPGFRCNGSRLS